MEAIAVELDDDVFFADLSKQISLLIMDDDEDLVAHSPSVSLQGFSQSVHPVAQRTLPFVSDQQTYRRESKGTGVFIPRSLISQPRRKNRQGRHSHNTSSNSKLQNNQDNSRGGLLPHVSHNYMASYDSFHPRKF